MCGVFLCFFLFSHTSRAFDTSVTGLNSCFLQHFHRVFFADFFRVQLCVVVSMTCYTIALFSTEVNELSTVNRAGRDYWTPLSCTCSPSSSPSKHKWKTHHKTQSRALVLFYQKQFLFKHSQENQKITLRSAAWEVSGSQAISITLLVLPCKTMLTQSSLRLAAEAAKLAGLDWFFLSLSSLFYFSPLLSKG